MRVDPNYVNNLAASIEQSSGAEQRLTNELSSGLRVAALADDPVAAAQSSLLNGAIGRDDTYVRTASREASVLQVGDAALGEVVRQLTTAISLGVQAGNGTLTAANRSALAQQVSGIRDQVLTLANTSYLGQAMFGGSQGMGSPFSLDTSTSPAVVTYNGDTKLQYVETPGGQKIPVNVPGTALFGSGSTGVFGVLNQLVADLSSGADASLDSGALSDALGQLTTQRSVLGSALSRVQATSNYAQTDAAQLRATQSVLMSADTVQVATDLKTVEIQHQALLSVMAALQKVSLFDYLH